MTPKHDHIASAFFAIADTRPDVSALGWQEHTEWRTLTYGQLANSVRRLAAALVRERLLPTEPVVIITANGHEWVIGHLAVLAAGAVSVPVDDDAGDETLVSLVRSTQARVVLVAGRAAHATLERIRPRLASVQLVVSLDDERSDHGFVRLSRLEKLPADLATAAEVQRRGLVWQGSDVATIHSHPASAGNRVGVVLSHESTMHTVQAMRAVAGLSGPPTLVMALPVSSAAVYWGMLATLTTGGCLWCATPDGFVAAVRHLRPTVVIANLVQAQELVERATDEVRARSGVDSDTIDRCVDLEHQARVLEDSGRRLPLSLRMARRAAHRRVLGPLRSAIGGPRELTVLAGQALPRPALMHLMRALDQQPCTLWGGHEVGGIATINPPGDHRPGSIGRALPGTTITIGEDDHLLVSGPGLMRGYFGETELTRAVLQDGWFHTDARGHIDDDGYAYLTSRSDDLILLTSLVHHDARPLEDAIENDPVVAEAVVLGESRPSLTALVHPDVSALRNAAGLPSGTPEAEVLENARAVRLVGDAVRRSGDGLPPAHRIRAFRIVSAPLGPPDARGVALNRRHRALRDHRDLVDGMYADLERARRMRRSG